MKNDDVKKRKGTKTHKIRAWGETIYNCPYLVAVIVTSVMVMICSDELGIRSVMKEVHAQIETIAGGAATHIEPSDQPGAPDKTITEDVEKQDQNDEIENENEGECKDKTTKENTQKYDITNKSDHKADGESTDPIKEEDSKNTENTGKMERIPEDGNNRDATKGVTRFQTYVPQEIDSYYYSDAGKIALTTEYPYRKENTSYFNDAAFLGDSRTLGISDYAGLDEADFYCDSGMTIYKILEPEGVTYQKTGSKVDLSQVLAAKRYGKIYIMLGMNELGYGNTGMYLDQYREVVEQIREWQPDAIIYIMANLHVSREKNNAETEFNNININDKNAASALLANGTDIFYLDANPLFTDADGYLNSELTFDGVHLYAKHYDVWKNFLLEHAVEAASAEQNGETGNAPDGAGDEMIGGTAAGAYGETAVGTDAD